MPGWRARRTSARSWNVCCRYITRPAVSTERLSLTTQGNIRYRLKTPYRDGTTDGVFEPLELMAHLSVRHPAVVQIGSPADLSWPDWAALVPTPRILTRYHGAINRDWRATSR